MKICNRKCEAKLFDTTRKMSKIGPRKVTELSVGSCSLNIQLKHQDDGETQGCFAQCFFILIKQKKVNGDLIFF